MNCTQVFYVYENSRRLHNLRRQGIRFRARTGRDALPRTSAAAPARRQSRRDRGFLTVAEDREAAGADVAPGWRQAHAAMAARAAAWLKAAMIAEMFRELLFFVAFS
jgi:hypothetical protein